MPNIVRMLPAIGTLLILLWLPGSVAGHAALERSEPAAGAVVPEPPREIRIWFTEPIEQAYTRAILLDQSGAPVQGASSAVAAGNAHELIVTLPANLASGGYTVAWRTLSAADGHTLEGYFGFSVGEEAASGAASVGTSSAGNETARTLSRWLALLGLAALIAIAPIMLVVIDPATRAVQPLSGLLTPWLRRYGVAASALALLGSAIALGAQAAAVAPEAALGEAIRQTLVDTRYGQLWLVRLALLALSVLSVGVVLWGRQGWRRAALLVGAALALATPLPFSLLSHASAQSEGRDTAIASDALHLLCASLWSGGLMLLAVVVLPAMRPLTAVERLAAWQAVIPRFSIIGVATWGILLLSGLYAAWLQVGTLEALRNTAYGQTLLLKGALLALILVLAAFHLLRGWRGVAAGDAYRLARTLVIEALLAIAVLLVVGRLIGLEPAREVIASRTPSALTVPLAFVTKDADRGGRLTITPGVAGNNTFTLDVDGGALPAGSEGVLRFALPSQDIGQQELRLPEAGANSFRADGPEISLAGEWQISAIVRKIGGFSWSAEARIPVGDSPPAVPEPNPAPHFEPVGISAMIAMAVGIYALAAALLTRGARALWRAGIVTVGVIALIAGSSVLGASRLPAASAPVSGLAASPPRIGATPIRAASPVAESHPHSAHVDHATPERESAAAAPGTPVSGDGISVAIERQHIRAGSADITLIVTGDDGAPVSGARVVVLSEMAGMDRDETIATESAPGRYVAEGVPLTMAGDWRLTVRVSPKGQSTQVFPFVVDVS